MKKKIKVPKYPLESEAISRQGQFELEKLSHQELLEFSKKNLHLLSQLTFYCKELVNLIEKEGYEVEPEG